MSPSVVVLVALSLPLLARHVAAQTQQPLLEKVYLDETHCLVAPEIRGATDKAISCYCRDAIADASYVRRIYLDTGKDRNLNGTYLGLEAWATQQCGDGYAVEKAVDSSWHGPEVTRTYPPDSVIEQIKPDSKGFRTVKYEVRLTYRSNQAQVTKVETFTAVEKLPLDFKSARCPPGARCPK